MSTESMESQANSSMQLDLTDIEIREMANRNHVPEEQWAINGVLIGVVCERCGNGWPCPTRLALRELGLDRNVWTVY